VRKDRAVEEKTEETKQNGTSDENGSTDSKTESVEVNSEMESLPPEGDDEARDLDFILDIPLEISVELGRTNMLVNDLLQLARGSIIELSKLAEEPMDIYINRKLFARGEVVVVNEKFGIRLTDIISPAERVKSLA
jgi:flagellar motor switch protein FliN/FliY